MYKKALSNSYGKTEAASSESTVTAGQLRAKLFDLGAVRQDDENEKGRAGQWKLSWKNSD